MSKTLQIICLTIFALISNLPTGIAGEITLNVRNEADEEQLGIIKKDGMDDQYFRYYPFGHADLHHSLNDLEASLRQTKKPPTLVWKFEDAMAAYQFSDTGINNRLVKWLKNDGKECVYRDTDPGRRDKTISCMEFAFFVAHNVKYFSGANTADLVKEEVQEDEFDRKLAVGDVVLLEAYNTNLDEATSFVGHTMIYVGNDMFISAQIDGKIYFQTFEQLRQLWAEPGEGVYDTILKLSKVKDASVIRDETGAARLLGSIPKPQKAGAKEPKAAAQKKREEDVFRAAFRATVPSYINHVQVLNYSHPWLLNEYLPFAEKQFFNKKEETPYIFDLIKPQ